AHHAGKRTPFGTCREGIQDAAYYDQGINLYSCALFLSLQNRKRAYLFRQQNNSRGYSVPQSTDENIFQFRKDPFSSATLAKMVSCSSFVSLIKFIMQVFV
ncbi:hypothetical protein, partial [Alistipes shahii]|uniref:hypothetical protein n=1 Tax=Alistipes shahii TaxID=328814 RepID=UPI003AB11A03